MPNRGYPVREDVPDIGPGTGPKAVRLALAGLVGPRGALGGRPGILSGLVVTGTAGPGWAYSVGPGHAVTSKGTDDGVALWSVSAAETVATSVAPGTGSRVDIVWGRHKDPEVAGEVDGVPELGVAQGGTGVPADAIELARFTVAAGQTSTSAATRSLTNTAYTASRGAPVSVANESQRATVGALAATGAPVWVWRRDAPAGRELEYTLDGVSWRTLSASPAVPWAQAAGVFSVAPLAAGATQTIAITFPVGRFTVPPIMSAPMVAVSSAAFVTSVTDITTAGANLRVSHKDGSSASLTYTGHWTALQMTPTSAAG